MVVNQVVNRGSDCHSAVSQLSNFHNFTLLYRDTVHRNGCCTKIIGAGWCPSGHDFV